MSATEYFYDRLEPWVVNDADCGVVTACDSCYYRGLLLLLKTLLGRVPVTVIDAGLTAYQVGYLEQEGCTVKRCARTPQLPLTHHTSWLKPWWIEQAGYRYTLWLDADTLVLRDLTPLFDVIKERVLLIRHAYGTAARTGYNGALNKLRPVKRVNSKEDHVNAGVLGFALERSEDAELLRQWQGLIEDALADAKLRKLISYWDEGALHWAMAKMAIQGRIVRDQPGWDRFVHLKAIDTLEEFYALLPVQNGDTILHLIGVKPWVNWVGWMPG